MTSAEISPTSSVTAGTTRAIIERTRSSRITNDQKAATLPRKGGGIFVKAHEAGRVHKIQAQQVATSTQKPTQIAAAAVPESFVDDVNDDHGKTVQTLPRSYKTGCNSSLKKKQSLPKQDLLNTSQLSNGVNLVLSANSFVSSTMPNGSPVPQKPIRPVLTVQEKLAQDLPSLPPQVHSIGRLRDISWQMFRLASS